MATRGVGTFAFMAPEQFDDPDSTVHVTTKSDVYGFGGVMIDVLTGRAPFTGSPPKTIYNTVVIKEQGPPEQGLLPAGSPVRRLHCVAHGLMSHVCVRLRPSLLGV